jgi:hypothetical protein
LKYKVKVKLGSKISVRIVQLHTGARLNERRT